MKPNHSDKSTVTCYLLIVFYYHQIYLFLKISEKDHSFVQDDFDFLFRELHMKIKKIKEGNDNILIERKKCSSLTVGHGSTRQPKIET